MTLKDIVIQLIVGAKRLLHIEDVRGEPFSIQGRTFIPVSQRLRIGAIGRGGGGGFVWNRPIALTEEIGDGIYRHHHIRDDTLNALVGILVSLVVFRVMIAVFSRWK